MTDQRRALVLVLDGVGCGEADDADAYGDGGAHTLGHILDRYPGLPLPTLWSLGLGQVLGTDPRVRPAGCHGRMHPRSAGKDSTTGHWELAGVILPEPFNTFERFPPELLTAIEREAGVTFIGNVAASGTAIVDDLGAEHLRTGRPILYTSADSVLQIAAHERVLPLPQLYAVCAVARRHADGYRIGRVIARPFTGEPGAFVRSAGRHDFSLPPPGPTVMDALLAAGVAVTSVGKTADLFAGRGFTASHPTASDAQGMATVARLWPAAGGLVFANLVDFDTVYGHRRDPAGYAAALVAFDRWLATFLPAVSADDLLVVTADHGNDPTFRGTDHTRERVPLLVRCGDRAGDLGERQTFADVAATVADFFGVPPAPAGVSFLGGR